MTTSQGNKDAGKRFGIRTVRVEVWAELGESWRLL
jgi:hypothetical protein